MLVVGLAAVVLVASGCASGDPGDGVGDTPAASRPAVESGAIAPGDFATFVSSNPDAPLVNVHVPYEGHIEGTDSFVAFDEIGDWGELPVDTSAPLAIYCRSGAMSATAADTLAALGYSNIVELDGGMKAWADVGYELLDDDPRAG